MDNQQLMYQVKSKRGFYNIVKVFENHTEVECYSSSGTFNGVVKVDKGLEDNVTPMRINTKGYAQLCCRQYLPIQHIVMNHKSSLETVVDHIDGDKLNNTKVNLRIVSAVDNANNRNTHPLNNTGVVGVIYRKHPVWNYEYYRATVSDRITPMKGAISKTKQISKQFNIQRLGKELAFKLACDWLKIKKKEFGYLD